MRVTWCCDDDSKVFSICHIYHSRMNMKSSFFKLNGFSELIRGYASSHGGSRFVKTMKFQQAELLNRLNEKFDKTYKSVLNPKGVRENKATPFSSIIDSDSGVRSVLKRRQNILNNIFLNNITDVLATNDIGANLRSLKVQITQVEVTRHYQNLRLYFYCDESLASTVIKELNLVKGDLTKVLCDLNVMGKIPAIEFVFDKASKTQNLVIERLKKADFGTKHSRADPYDYVPPKEEPPPKDQNPKIAKHIWSLTLFDQEFASRGENWYEKKKESPLPEFNYPDDMRLDIFGLDYKEMIKKILFYANKSRKEDNYFSTADPLPPVEWKSFKPMGLPVIDKSDPANDFEERTALMKKFVVQNTKKKLILSREAKKNYYERNEETAERLKKVQNFMAGNYSHEDVCKDFDEIDKEEKDEFYRENYR